MPRVSCPSTIRRISVPSWGTISDRGVAAAVDSADVYLFVRPVFSDYSTAGDSCLLHSDGRIEIGVDSVTVDGRNFEEYVKATCWLPWPQPWRVSRPV